MKIDFKKPLVTISCLLMLVNSFVLVATATELDHAINDENAVVDVLQRYKDAIQNLSTEGTFELFVADSKVFEQGGVEGTYAHYVEHHLGPELSYFESFTFSDYQVNVELAGDYAFAVETYLYNIVINAHDDKPRRVIDKKGLATSILIRTETGWKIKHNHSSSRAVKKMK